MFLCSDVFCFVLLNVSGLQKSFLISLLCGFDRFHFTFILFAEHKQTSDRLKENEPTRVSFNTFNTTWSHLNDFSEFQPNRMSFDAHSVCLDVRLIDRSFSDRIDF